ncbi:MAG: DUF3617 domain-containing protein [Terriglobales bacterium]|jgi:hypothetical protein
MRNTLVLALLFVGSLTLCAADDVPFLDVKQGLWEVSTTHSMKGMPTAQMGNIPPDVLAKMSPDQRAKIEAMMSGKPSTDVRKECITKEKLEKRLAFTKNRGERGECSRTVVSSTGRKLELKIHCVDNDTTSDGTAVMEAISSDTVKGTMHFVTKTSENAITMDFTTSSKYLGPACGDVK